VALVAAVQQRRRGRLLAAILAAWRTRAANQELLARQEQTAARRSIARFGQSHMLCTAVSRAKHSLTSQQLLVCYRMTVTDAHQVKSHCLQAVEGCASDAGSARR